MLNHLTKDTKTPDFIRGEIIIFDKAKTWTSFNVVNKVRNRICKKYGLKKIKVGHAGTLDPLATGLLILTTGKYTKLIEEIQQGEKIYEAVFCLGATTPSFDLEKEIDQRFDYSQITEAQIIEAIESMKGTSLQSPPIYSAIKKDGKRAYEYTRKGREVELDKRCITISEIQIQKIEMPYVHLRIECSKGTYIRSLADDFGKRLNNGAYLHELRRTNSGYFNLDDAFTLEDFDEYLNNIQ